MDVTFLIKDDTYQLVFTPDTENERKMFKLIEQRIDTAKINWGHFYGECQGGWYRPYRQEDSLILIMESEEE